MLFIIFLFCFTSFADQTPEETIKNMSKITPSFYSKEMYGAMQDTPDNPTNNLRRKSGSPFFAKGIPLFIEGRVFDISGEPIKNVIVKITHANHYGAYNFIVGKESAVYDPYFLSSGISVTNNIGEYSFLTIMPGFYGKRAPHIHLTIVHETFEFETEMFFANHPRNIKDAKYHKLNSSEKKAVTAKVYYVDQNNFSLGIKVVFDIYINYDF